MGNHGGREKRGTLTESKAKKQAASQRHYLSGKSSAFRYAKTVAYTERSRPDCYIQVCRQKCSANSYDLKNKDNKSISEIFDRRKSVWRDAKKKRF